MADLDYLHNQVLIFDGIEDAITSLSYTVLLLAGDFLDAVGARVVGQLEDTLDQSLTILLRGNSFDFFDRGRLNQEPIFCHAASGLSELPQTAGWARPGVPGRRPGLQHPRPG